VALGLHATSICLLTQSKNFVKVYNICLQLESYNITPDLTCFCQLSFRKTGTVGTLVSKAEIGVWVQAPPENFETVCAKILQSQIKFICQHKYKQSAKCKTNNNSNITDTAECASRTQRQWYCTNMSPQKYKVNQLFTKLCTKTYVIFHSHSNLSCSLAGKWFAMLPIIHSKTLC